jgi:hypothetical protein
MFAFISIHKPNSQEKMSNMFVDHAPSQSLPPSFIDANGDLVYDLTVDDSEAVSDSLHWDRTLNRDDNVMRAALLNIVTVSLSSECKQQPEVFRTLSTSIIERLISEFRMLRLYRNSRLLASDGLHLRAVNVCDAHKGMGVEKAVHQGLLFILASCYTDDSCSFTTCGKLVTTAKGYLTQDAVISIDHYKKTSAFFAVTTAITQAVLTLKK